MNLVEKSLWNIRSSSRNLISFRREIVVDLINEQSEDNNNNKVLPYNSGAQCEFVVSSDCEEYNIQVSVEYRLRLDSFQKAEIILYNRYGEDMCTNSVKVGVDNDQQYVHFGWRGLNSGEREDRSPFYFPRGKPDRKEEEEGYWKKTVNYHFHVTQEAITVEIDGDKKIGAEIILNEEEQKPSPKRMIEVIGFNRSEDDSHMIIKECILTHSEEVKEEEEEEEIKTKKPKIRRETYIRKGWKLGWYVIKKYFIDYAYSFAQGVLAQVINHFLRDFLICCMWTFLVCFIITFIGAAAIYLFGSYFLCRSCDCPNDGPKPNGDIFTATSEL